MIEELWFKWNLVGLFFTILFREIKILFFKIKEKLKTHMLLLLLRNFLVFLFFFLCKIV